MHNKWTSDLNAESIQVEVNPAALGIAVVKIDDNQDDV